MSETVQISLGKDESVVLFEFLSRFSLEERLTIKDESETLALWALLAMLEKNLTESFADDYSEVLSTVRKNICIKNQA